MILQHIKLHTYFNALKQIRYYFVTYNRHFAASKAKQYVKVISQADFVKLFGIEPQPTKY